VAPTGANIIHSIQSNGTLLNQSWCDFIKRHDIRVGLSIGGPDFLHDLHRKSRRGVGTHRAAMHGLQLLEDNEIPFHIIAVITSEALDHAQEIYEFFESAGCRAPGVQYRRSRGRACGLDIGRRTRRTRPRVLSNDLRKSEEAPKYYDSRIRGGRAKDSLGISLREFDFPWFNEQVRPFGIISVDWEGNFSTYSPDLLGMSVDPYGDFCFGNVLRDHFADALETPKFRQVLVDIQTGIKRCAERCSYYGYCGAGAPANKYYENGSLASTQTIYCRYAVQMPLDIVLNDMERTLQITA
jgi:uncharacterized protein